MGFECFDQFGEDVRMLGGNVVLFSQIGFEVVELGDGFLFGRVVNELPLAASGTAVFVEENLVW